MKRLLLIFLLAYSLSPMAYSQDVQRFAERDVVGTARYMGMGGAMTAIGGDPSSVLDNPAGLGLYRRSELSITIDERLDYTQQVSAKHSYNRRLENDNFTLPQASLVWAIGNPNKQKGLIYSNLMFFYNSLANYHRDIEVKGSSTELLQTLCLKTHGLPESSFDGDPWGNEEIGWLSILGYEAYLIDPYIDPNATNEVDKYAWKPALELEDATLSIEEYGSSEQYTFSWAGNINNQWYVGVNLNIPTLSYTKHMSLYEYNRTASANLKSMYSVSGVGVGGSVGLIYRPIQQLRFGASFQTPTTMTLSLQTEGDMYSSIESKQYEVLTPNSGIIETKIVSPLRTSFSVAGQLGNYGLLAVQYDYAHTPEMDDIHTIRLGAEAQLTRGLYLNAGYVYESSFMPDDPIVELDFRSIRTDTDYRYCQNTQYFSLGFGYRSDFVVAQLAYQYRWQYLHQYATEMQIRPFDIMTQTHRVAATIAWRI